MKKMIRLITLGASVALLSLPIAAKSLAVETQDQCSDENKSAYYKTFLENRKPEQDQAKAYEHAKKYLACPPPADITPQGQGIIEYLKKFATAYEAAKKQGQLPELLYIKKDYNAAYTLARELTAAEPENLKYLVDLGANGYLLVPLKNPGLNNEALNYARKAIQMLEAGKTLEDWKPLTGKEDSLAYLNYTIGTLTLEQDPSNALKNLLKAAQYESSLKKEPFTYAYIGGAYETGPYAKQSDQYKANFQGKDETPESKLALANINQIVDRMIDAYARAVALSGSNATYAEPKKVWTATLTDWWKYRNNQQPAGMTEFVAGVLAKPLPPEPTPLTSLPTPPAAATPVATPTATAGNGATTAATTTAPAGAKPAPKPTPGGPNKPRN